jgi:hypothetical protein
MEVGVNWSHSDRKKENERDIKRKDEREKTRIK